MAPVCIVVQAADTLNCTDQGRWNKRIIGVRVEHSAIGSGIAVDGYMENLLRLSDRACEGDEHTVRIGMSNRKAVRF